MKPENCFDLPQGTLDLLIMRIVALGPFKRSLTVQSHRHECPHSRPAGIRQSVR
jgi:hypothetical protein